RRLADHAPSAGSISQRGTCQLADTLLVSPAGTRLLVRFGGQMLVYDANDLTRPPALVLDEKPPDWFTSDFSGRSVAWHPEGWFVALTDGPPTVRFLDPTSWRWGERVY